MKKHGLSGTRVHKAWQNMRARCYRPTAKGYEYYGGCGIKVCKRWLTFERFFSDMGHPPSAKHYLDRLDVTKDYSPSNCRWATFEDQADSCAHVRLLRHGGKLKSIAQIAREEEVPYMMLWRRIHRGLDLREAITRVQQLSR